MRSLTLLLGLSSLVGCGEAPVAKSPADTGGLQMVEMSTTSFNPDGAPTVEIEVPGMHCGACAAGICEALESSPGVVDVKADAETKVATIAISETDFDQDAALAAIAEKYGEATVKGEAETEAVADGDAPVEG